MHWLTLSPHHLLQHGFSVVTPVSSHNPKTYSDSKLPVGVNGFNRKSSQDIGWTLPGSKYVQREVKPSCGLLTTLFACFITSISLLMQ